MTKAFRTVFIGRALPGAALAAAALLAVGLQAQEVKVTDPTSVLMIVNRDSNDIGFMDLKTRKMIGRTFLGNNVNPHMVMMSPDGRYVVTGGTRANKAYVIDTRTLQLHLIPVDTAALIKEVGERLVQSFMERKQTLAINMPPWVRIALRSGISHVCSTNMSSAAPPVWTT